MKWPFSLTLKNIALDGKEKEIARARYELSGEELDRTLLDITYDDKQSENYKLKSLELDKKYKKISDEEFERETLDITHTDKNTTDYKLKSLELDKKYKKLPDMEYEKEVATLKDEPWVGYKDYGLEEQDNKTGFWFELDWNDIFVKKLRLEGYEGITDDEVVRKWYAELCRVVALEEGLALDLFEDTDMDGTVPIKKKRNTDGTVDYS